uniref:BZIP domain-containing protein n=1 Tax=Periophthalmus magnuspinnatus TaxID=409849 RepID=A0A3B3ZPC7_9GOBI
RHKHEMTLKFNSIKTDTPTPTKFLQNCDEVGLFKEIEEEFLQAQEEEKKQRLKHPLGPPFPQPRLMPMNRAGPPMGHMMDMMSPRQQAPPLQHHPQLSPPPVSYQQRFHIPPPQHIAHGHSHHLHQNVPPTQAHQSPPPRLHPGSPLSNALSNAQVLPLEDCAGPSGPPGAVARRRRTSEQDPDERRQKFLERNRAAATRCRQKRKLWVSSLEKKAEELTHTNLQLQNEVTSLRSEVGQLKQILLTHKDCPVTARQREGQVKAILQNIRHGDKIYAILCKITHTLYNVTV